MESGFISSLSADELTTIGPSLLQDVLRVVPTGIQVLRAIRNNDNEIIDFEYILLNHARVNHESPGKTFLAENPGKKDLFEQLVNEVVNETGNGAGDSFAMNGDTNWFHIRYKKFGDGVLLSIEDITQKKGLKDITLESQHLLQQIAETTPDIIYILDLNTGLVTYSNRPMAAELGYSAEQIKNMKNSLLDVVYEPDLESMKQHFEKAKTISDDSVLEIEYRVKNENGTLSWFCTRTTIFKRNQKGVPVEKLGISQNITAKKNQEEQILTNLGLLNQAEDISSLGTWVYDLKTSDFSWSNGMYKLFDLPIGRKITPDIYLDFAPAAEQENTRSLVEKIRTADPIDKRIHLQIPGKGTKIVKIKAIPIYDKSGKPAKSVGVDRDITEQVELEQKIDALNDNLSTANHELATVNLELQTFSSIAANDYKETLKHLYTSLEYITTVEAANLSNTGRANIRRSQAAIQKMKLLTEDIILYSSIQNLDGKETLVDLMEIFENIKKYYDKRIKEEDIHIDCIDLPVVRGHQQLLTLMFRHLVDNAIKFSQAGKKTIIHISCTKQEAAEIRSPSAVPGKKYEVLSIIDNGHGFQPDLAEDIFKMFYRVPNTKNQKGSGMGLAICKKIMDIHKGFITAESIPGEGASFYCYFPVE